MSKFLWLRPLAHRWFGSPGRRARAPRPAVSSRRRVRLSLEALEDRITPSMFTPTTFADDGSAESLRGTIAQANNDTGTATDTIQLQAGPYTLSIPNTGNIHEQENASGDLNITNTSHALVIQGVTDANGKPTTIIDQTVADRVFQIVNAGTTVTFKDLIIEGGNAQEDGSVGAVAGKTDAEGGGILDDGGNVTLSNVVLQTNQAAFGRSSGLDALGGGIYVDKGSLTVKSSVIQLNAVFGDFTSGGIGSNGGIAEGAGIYADGPTIIQSSVIQLNHALGGDGSDQDNSSGGFAGGGGIYAGGQTTIADSTLSGNTVAGGNTTSTSGGFGGGASGGGLDADGPTILTHSTLSGNSATSGSDSKAAARSLPAIGGGLATTGTMTITDCTLSGNTVAGGNGGEAGGGGVATTGTATTTIADSTLSGNTAMGGSGGTAGDAIGGGALLIGTSTTLVNSTIAGNQAVGGKGTPSGPVALGGGLLIAPTAASTLTNVTVAGNKANSSPEGGGSAVGGGIVNLGGAVASYRGTLTLVNTLVALNNAAADPDYLGTVSSSSHNLIGNTDGSIGFSTAHGDLLGTPANPLDPQLGPLINNGGPTQTVALRPGSPAIDAGDNSAQSVTGPFDQRGNGFDRVVNGTIDIGAFEVQTPTNSTPSTMTTITTPSVTSTYNSTIPQPVTLSAGVAASNGSPVNEGNVTFTVTGTSLTATGVVTGGTATATLTLPAGFAAGSYSFAASYTDNNANYSDSTSVSGTLTVNETTVTITPLNIANAITTSHKAQAVTLAANVASANGGTINEGVVTFTLINPNGPNLTATGNVSNGAATATLTLPARFASGTYVYLAGYADPNNGNGVPNYAANGGAGTVDPPSGSGTATFTVANAPSANPPAGSGSSPSPAPPATLRTPPLLALFDALLAGVETVNGNATETVVDRIFGIPLFISTYDSAGNLVSVTLFGIDVTLLIETL